MFDMAVLTNLLFVLALRLTVTTKVDLQKRIIDGTDCGPEERPYHVKFIDQNGYLRCGGSLISDRWILTAAHCWDNITHMEAILSPHPGQGQNRPLLGKPHFLFNRSGQHDIMLLELEQPTTTKFIPLPNCENRLIQTGDVVRIAGYGSQAGPNNEKNGPEAQVLQCGNFTVVNKCVPRFTSGRNCTHCFCVDTTLVDTSPGDSGGGVEFHDTIYGLHLGGGNISHQSPAYFADVCHYMDWIKTTMGI